MNFKIRKMMLIVLFAISIANIANADGSFEHCFGGMGSHCGGVPTASFTDHGNYIQGYVSVGSILHDNCCIKNPGGKWCGGVGTDGKPAEEFNHNGQCTLEWDKAFWNVANRRFWSHNFPAGGGHANLETIRGRRSLFSNGTLSSRFETVATRALSAPRGTPLDKGDEAFCASQSATNVTDWFGNVQYITCN